MSSRNHLISSPAGREGTMGIGVTVGKVVTDRRDHRRRYLCSTRGIEEERRSPGDLLAQGGEERTDGVRVEI